MDEWTVMSAAKDPYRGDSPDAHVIGRWFAEQVARLPPHGTVHLRGLHYMISATAGIIMPDGREYINNDECWEFLQQNAARSGRWLGYVQFNRIHDGRNEPPFIYVPREIDSDTDLFNGAPARIPSIDGAMPCFDFAPTEAGE